MATELWGDFKVDVGITITPVHDGRLEVYVNGDKVFDRKEEGGKYPGLDRVREIKSLIKQKLEVAVA